MSAALCNNVLSNMFSNNVIYKEIIHQQIRFYLFEVTNNVHQTLISACTGLTVFRQSHQRIQ